ncbi:MAG: 50S ribosomal protein L29 [Bacilli bacterium]|jgi:large subunit ribosomal protein L29|nr:50S ribosomal protein L29 [Bacilli bacterium]NLN80838.1 50S ribosomal protein L29 [Erysipelotrichia bacterium]
MKIKELREMSNEELKEKVYLLKEQLFHLRRKKAVGQLERGEEIRQVRKDIARVYTIQRERELGIK